MRYFAYTFQGVPWVPETFLTAEDVSENSRRLREKPLVPRVSKETFFYLSMSNKLIIGWSTPERPPEPLYEYPGNDTEATL